MTASAIALGVLFALAVLGAWDLGRTVANLRGWRSRCCLCRKRPRFADEMRMCGPCYVAEVDTTTKVIARNQAAKRARAVSVAELN